MLFGCGAPHTRQVDSTIPNPAPYVTPAGDKIIFLDDYYTGYLKAVRLNFKKNDSLLDARAFAPIHKRYFLKSGNSVDRNPNTSFTIHDTTGLDDIIAGIETNKAQIERLITSELADCRGYLKNDSLTFYISPSSQDMKKILKGLGGVSSWAISKKNIIIMIDPRISTWSEMLQYNIAHDYSHTFCWDKMNLGALLAMNLLDRVVAEGKADAFAHLLYPDVKCPWDTALSAEETQYQWSRIKMEMRSEEYYQIQGIMFGSDNYPAWTGYNVGYEIVQSALKNNPALTPEQWTNQSPAWILDASDYKAK